MTWSRARRLRQVVQLVFFALFIFLPLALVFAEAFKKGWEAYVAAWTEKAALDISNSGLDYAALQGCRDGQPNPRSL